MSAATATGSRAGEWLEWLVGEMFRAMHNLEQDNFDAGRYRGILPGTFFPEHHARYFLFVLRHGEDFFRARTLLSDEDSQHLFDRLVLFRILGHLHIRLPYNNEQTKQYESIADGWRVRDTNDHGLLGPLAVFAVPGEKRDPILLKCWRENVMGTFLNGQYYLRRGPHVVVPLAGDQIIDAGGCFGDTAIGFASAVGASGHVHTFDPLPKHCAIIRENLEMNPALARRISVHECGLSDVQRTGTGLQSDRIDPGATAFDDAISTTTLDDLAASGSVGRVDFIKMDIEGSELAALRGAEGVLRRDRPRLAISLYHRPEDFFAIPLWVDSLECGYRFFLDHYSIHHEETVLYARV